jgi:hypothetical protein
MLRDNKGTVFAAGVAVAVLILVTGAVYLYWAANAALDAEKTNGAFIVVLKLVSSHIEKTSGQWPRSWDDLQRLSQPDVHYDWRWPDDMEEIQKRIRIDFSVTTADVATQNPDSFHAIQQIGHNYGSYDSHILLSVCKKYAQGTADSREKNASSP